MPAIPETTMDYLHYIESIPNYMDLQDDDPRMIKLRLLFGQSSFERTKDSKIEVYLQEGGRRYFESVLEASRELGIPRKAIREAMPNGETVNGYKFVEIIKARKPKYYMVMKHGELVAKGGSKSCAEQLGVSTRTLWNWANVKHELTNGIRVFVTEGA